MLSYDAHNLVFSSDYDCLVTNRRLFFLKMGGCYSSESHRALSSSRLHHHRDKLTRHIEKKAHHYTTVSNGTSSHPTAAHTITRHISMSVCAEDVEVRVDSHLSEYLEEQKGVAPSDSGIESIGPGQDEAATPEPTDKLHYRHFTLCQSCQLKLRRLSVGSCRNCGQVKVSSSELSALVHGETYCTCGPRQLGKQSECTTHSVRGKPIAANHRHSDIPTSLLKSNLKKAGLDKGDESSKHVHMSWKSADCLDEKASAIIGNMCLDRAKSEQSEVFGDDVSFRAPLAQFDSVDKHLDGGAVWCDGAILASRMSIYSELLDVADSICKCDFSAAVTANSLTGKASGATKAPDSSCTQNFEENRQQSLAVEQVLLDAFEDDDSGHGRSKSNDHSASLFGSERDVEEDTYMEGKTISFGSSPYRHGALESLQLDDIRDLELMGPVSIMVKGRQMVMIDADTYKQLLNDLAVLREQLGLLTQVIWEEDLQTIEPLDLTVDDGDSLS